MKLPPKSIFINPNGCHTEIGPGFTGFASLATCVRDLEIDESNGNYSEVFWEYEIKAVHRGGKLYVPYVREEWRK